MKNYLRSLLTLTLFATLGGSAVAQVHSHLYIGAPSTNQNEQLIFDNSGDFAAASQYVKTLDYAPTGTYAGYFQGNITFTVRATTSAHLGPETNAPALGSWMFAQLIAVEGPPGGAFAFWENGATVPTLSLASGTTGAYTNIFVVSQNNGVPGTDPFGHIHGRRFTATKAGIYTATFRAFDYSTNGVGGGPIYMTSDPIKICFQAGVNLKSVQPGNESTTVTFGAQANFVWQVEATDSLPAGTNWQAVGGTILGNDYFRSVQDLEAGPRQRFYRVSGVPFVPP